MTAEGILVVADEYVAGESLGNDYLAGPVWHLAYDRNRSQSGSQKRNWFAASALDHAWWQEKQWRVVCYIHDDGKLKYGAIKQAHSQDTGANLTTYAFRPIAASKPERFLSVFVPHDESESTGDVIGRIKTQVTPEGTLVAAIRRTTVTMTSEGDWHVSRSSD